jgi:hypothetical protein
MCCKVFNTAMNRTPPTGVLRQLRREVGFGCPFPGCRDAILTWHHFDPPWRREQHHRPEGMIALCQPHANAADRDLFSASRLRELKTSTHSVEEVKARFPWTATEFLIRLGGSYSGGESVPLAVGGKPIIHLSRDGNGLLALSAELRAPDGALLASIQENMFEADPAHIHDLVLDTAPTKVKIWIAKREIGLELSFRRITADELDTFLAEDHRRASHDIEALLPEEVRRFLAEYDPDQRRQNMATMLSGSNLPPTIREAAVSGDPTGTLIRAYAKRMADDEAKVAFLNFQKLHVYSNGRELIVVEGLKSGSVFVSHSASLYNRQGGFNL